MLCGSPDWRGFASQVVGALEKGGVLSFLEAEQLRGVGDPRRTLSIAMALAKEKGIDKFVTPIGYGERTNFLGGGTTTGMAMVAKSAPDGYTLLVNSTSYVVVASTYAKLPYDPYNDMIGIALLAHLPFTITTTKKYKTLAEFVAAGQVTPTPLNYGSTGNGSSGHLFGERFKHAAKFDAKHVPFRGTPEAMTEVIAGRLDMFPAPIPSITELGDAGRVNVLAVSTAKRSIAFPNVPTTIEAGYPNSNYNFWMGSYMPAKTPREIVDRLNAEVRKAVQDPGITAKLKLLGGEPELMTVDAFNEFIRKEREVNAEIVKLTGYKPQ